MTNIITKASFKNPYLIFVRDETPAHETETELNELIADKQEDFLKKLIGVRLYQYWSDNPTDVMWTNFRDGVEYTYEGVKYNWRGIKEVFARMMYYHWHRHKQTQLTEDGESQIKYKYNKKVVPDRKMAAQWNKAVDILQNATQYEPTAWHYLNTQLSGTPFDYLDYGFFKRVNFLF